MPVHHSPKGRQEGIGKAGVFKTPNKSCVVDDGFQVKRAKHSRRGSPIKDGESENERKSVNVDQANPQNERKQ